MSVHLWLLGCLPLTAVVSCSATPKPAPAVPPPSAAQAATPAAAPEIPQTTVGNLDPQVVVRYIDSHRSKVKDCWESSLKTNPTLAGKIVMRWTIDLDGIPRGVSVESNSMPPSPVPDCVRAVIEKWRFPSPSAGDVTVSFPFIFHAARAR